HHVRPGLRPGAKRFLSQLRHHTPQSGRHRSTTIAIDTTAITGTPVKGGNLGKVFCLEKTSEICSGYRQEVDIDCRECPSRHHRGSGWAVLALGIRLALGATTSVFNYYSRVAL